MIHYLKIRNFGPVREEAEISFEAVEDSPEAYEVMMPDKTRLLKLAYIYGANASGKTTVLKALDFLKKLLLKPISDKSLELDYEPFLFCESPYEKESSLELSFYVEGTRYVYQVFFNKVAILREKIVYYQTAKPTEFFSRSTDLKKRLAKIEFGNRVKVPVREKDLLEGNTLHNNTVIGAYSKTNVDIAELEKLHKWFSNFFLGLITPNDNLPEITASYIGSNRKANAWISSFMHKADRQIAEVRIYDDLISELSPAEGFYLSHGAEKPVYYEFKQRIDFLHKLKTKVYSLPLYSESNGTKRFFGLAGPLFVLSHNSHILCIDELDTSLHPDLMIFFLQVFLMNSKNSQMLFTTHNVALMENMDFLRKDALWFSEKTSEGSVNLYSASDFDSSVLRKDSNVLKAYKAGKLGAKPNLGSPYIIEE